MTDVMIDMANDINDYVINKGHKHSPEAIVEMKKAEMYLRKAFIMHRTFNNLADGMYDMAIDTDETYVKKVNAALIRDFRHIKNRDSMDSYEI